MNKSESIAALAAALATAQGEVENASKNAKNPHFRNAYADLAEILNTVRPVFSKHGLSLVQMPSFSDGVCHVETLLTHASGEWISNTASAPVGKLDAQGVGSAITYLRRYSLAAFCGIAQEDDDGNAAASGRAVNAPVSAPKPQVTPESVKFATEALRACQSLSELKDTFTNLPPDVRERVGAIKDEMKEKLS
jgi:hypothetical protein